jgi:hypothetical protein
MDNRFGDTPKPDAATTTAEDSTQRVKDATGNAVTEIKAAAGSAMKDAKHAAMQHVEGAREKAGEMGHNTASRFRDLAGQVEQDMPWLSGAFTKSAEGLDSVTDSLTRGDFGQTLNELADFAKRQPAIFLGASVALGFALARIGKTAIEDASQSQQTAKETPQPFDGADTSYPTPTGV